jgi:hypothetical protein
MIAKDQSEPGEGALGAGLVARQSGSDQSDVCHRTTRIITKATRIRDHQGTLSLPELGRWLPFPILFRMQAVVPNPIGDCLIYTKEPLEMNLKLREEP